MHNVMLFDLETSGHHATYIKHLVRYWCVESITGQLNIVVSPGFISKHRSVINLLSNFNEPNVNFIAIGEDEHKDIEASTSLALQTLKIWQLLCNYARQLKVDHCVVMWFDHILQLPIALRMRAPCLVSGICFRPMFHYDTFGNNSLSIQDRIKQWRQKLLISRATYHPDLAFLFCLDPFVVQHIKSLNYRAQAIHLPDPVQINPVSSQQAMEFKKSSNIQPHRKVFLFFGAIAERKGIYQLLEAIHQLAPNLCEQICLLLVGEVMTADKTAIKGYIKKLEISLPIQIICQDEYVSDREVNQYFAMTDVVLAPYQKHVGMSGILLLAAAAQKPVISSDYGLMGELIRRYELGLVVDTTKPARIADGIRRMLNEPLSRFGNSVKMLQFAKDNSSEKFAKVIFNNILGLR